MTQHLSEERLFECYLAERSGDGVVPPAAEHLADCRRCHDEYAQLVAFMDGAWATADAETSEVFTPDHLRRQQEEIGRRLELFGHGARLLSFPVGPDGRQSLNLEKPTGQLSPLVSRVTTRWVAAAAAAGLFIGVAAGVLYDRRASSATSSAPTRKLSTAMRRPPEAADRGVRAGRADRSDAPASVSDPSDPGNDDIVLMSELEAALDRPRTAELMALDAFTPHAREITYRIR